MYFLFVYNITLIPVIIGALVFFISQVLLRIPLIKYVRSVSWFNKIKDNKILYALFLALTEGVFEEIGRYFGMYILLY